MMVLLLVVIYIAFIGLGLPDSLLGAAWPAAHIDLGVSVTAAGAASIIAAAGTVISSLISARMIKRYGTGIVTAVSVGITSAALLGISFAGSYWVLLALSLPLGMGAGTVDTALNNFVALHYKSRHMNWLHCFWGVGATAGPLVMSVYLAVGYWRGAYRSVSLVLLAITVILACSMPLWKRAGTQAQEEESRENVPLLEAIRLPGAVSACVAFFAYCSLEYSVGLWAATYFVNAKGINLDTAAAWASMFFLGITAGRLLSGFAAIKLHSRTLVRIGQALAVTGVAVLLLPSSGVVQVVGLVLIGLGCAPIFPSLLDQTPEFFGVRCSQSMMGLQFASAYLGGTLMAPLFGWLSPLFGLESWPLYLLVLFALLIMASERTQRATANAHAGKNR